MRPSGLLRIPQGGSDLGQFFSQPGWVFPIELLHQGFCLGLGSGELAGLLLRFGRSSLILLLQYADVSFLLLEHPIRDNFSHGFCKIWMVRRAADWAGLALLEVLGQQHGTRLPGQFAQVREFSAGCLPGFLCCLSRSRCLSMADRGFPDE